MSDDKNPRDFTHLAAGDRVLVGTRNGPELRTVERVTNFHVILASRNGTVSEGARFRRADGYMVGGSGTSAWDAPSLIPDTDGAWEQLRSAMLHRVLLRTARGLEGKAREADARGGSFTRRAVPGDPVEVYQEAAEWLAGESARFTRLTRMAVPELRAYLGAGEAAE